MATSTPEAISDPLFPNGVTTSFPFEFDAPSRSEVSVILVEADGSYSTVDPTLYSVTLNTPASTGGTVTFGVAPADGTTLYVLLDPLFTQSTNFSQGGDWIASVINSALDRSAFRDRALRRDIGRAISAPLGETGLTLPTQASRAGYFLGFNAEGDPVAVEGTGDDGTIRPDLASPDPTKGSALINHKGVLVSDLLDGVRPRAYVTDQPGSTAYDRLQYALEAAGGAANGADVFGDDTQQVSLGSGQYIEAPSKVEVHGNRMLIDVDATIDRPVRAQSGGNDISFFDLVIDCKGNNDSAGLSAEGVHGFIAEGVEVKRFVDYAIDVYSDVANKRAAKNVRVERCYSHTPDASVAFAIVLRSVNGGPFVEGAKVLRNLAIGVDPENRPSEPPAYLSGGTADQIVLQGVHDFEFSHNRSMYSGAAGVSLSRGCKNGLVMGNFVALTHESFNIGSGIEFVYVNDLSGFVVGQNGDQNGTNGGTTARKVSSTSSASSAEQVSQGWLTSIRPNTGPILNRLGETGATGPGWLGIASPSGGLFTVGETIAQGALATRTIVDVIYSAQNIDLIGNTLRDTGIKNGDPGDPQYSGIYGVLNFIRTRGDNTVVDNKYFDQAGIGKATALVANSNSLLGVGQNYWNGAQAGEGLYSRASPAGAWAWTAFAGGGAVSAAGRFGSTGVLSGNTGTNITSDAVKGGNGQYTITLDSAVDDYLKVLIDVTAITTDGQISAQMTDNTTVEVRTRASDGTLTDKAFSIIIREP